jgi:A/G-specific adenine glycosylase
MSVPEARQLRSAILAWYSRGHRALPWRGSRDPYAVLVSEVMLQQTQAARVALRYPAFMQRFPSAAALASASEADVLAEWSGLGYNGRALALHRAASAVAAGGWPPDLRGLMALPGVGAYTARAIGSLAFGWPVGAVDTNVRRWLVRRLGLEIEGSSGAAADLQELADALASDGCSQPTAEDAATWTHASMELGAVVCRARQPACDACPVAVGCPSRGRAVPVPVPRQGPFPGSVRAYRGALLRALASAPNHALPQAQVPSALRRFAAAGALTRGLDRRRVGTAILGLERDGLAHLDGRTLRLGPAKARRPPVQVDPAAARRPPATIAE